LTGIVFDPILPGVIEVYGLAALSASLSGKLRMFKRKKSEMTVLLRCEEEVNIVDDRLLAHGGAGFFVAAGGHAVGDDGAVF
jgi:hypothetical protein